MNAHDATAAAAAATLAACSALDADAAPAVASLRSALAQYRAAVENRAAADATAAELTNNVERARAAWLEVQSDAAWSKVDQAKTRAAAAAGKAAALADGVERAGAELAAAHRAALAAERAELAAHYARTVGPLLTDAVALALSLDGRGAELNAAVAAHQARTDDLFKRLRAAGEVEAVSELAPRDFRAKLSGLELLRVAFGQASGARPAEIPDSIAQVIATDRQRNAAPVEARAIDAAVASTRRPAASTAEIMANWKRAGDELFAAAAKLPDDERAELLAGLPFTSAAP